MSDLKRLSALGRIVQSGNNKFLFEEIKEQRKFDLRWIDTLENLLPHVERAASNTRESIKVEQEVVAIEKVQRVDASSIRHLAAHSNLVREITETGEVIPSQLLTSFKVADYGIYENRFLKTLINRVYRYLTIRHQAIQKNYASYLRRELEIDSKFKYRDENITISIQLEGRQDIDLEAGGQSYEQIMARIERLLLMVKGLKYSRFMRYMETEKEIRPPIFKTNVILKNVDFIAAYNLWTFIDRETSLNFEIDHRARKLDINASFQNDVYKIIGEVYRKYIYYTSKQRINYKAAELLRKKKPKIVKGFSGKFVIPDDEIKVENPQIFEYYLQEITKQIHKNYSDFVVAGRSKKEASERVLRDLLAVADTIFDNINLEAHPPSQDLKMQLKHQEDEERVISSFIAVKEVNLRKYKRKLATLRRHKKKTQTQIVRHEKQEKLRLQRMKEREKLQKEQAKIEKAALLAKQKEKQEKRKQAALEKLKIEAEKLARKQAREQALLLKQKEAADKKRARELAKIKKQGELAKQNELLAKQKVREKEKQAKAKTALLEKEKLLKAKAVLLEKEKLAKTKELQKIKIQKEVEKQNQAQELARLEKQKKVVANKALEQDKKRREKETLLAKQKSEKAKEKAASNAIANAEKQKQAQALVRLEKRKQLTAQKTVEQAKKRQEKAALLTQKKAENAKLKAETNAKAKAEKQQLVALEKAVLAKEKKEAAAVAKVEKERLLALVEKQKEFDKKRLKTVQDREKKKALELERKARKKISRQALKEKEKTKNKQNNPQRRRPTNQ